MRHSFYLAEIPPMPLRHLSWIRVADEKSGSLHEDLSQASYQRVERLQYPEFRPVLILGPSRMCRRQACLRFSREIQPCSNRNRDAVSRAN
ncbi:hypothetical protein NQ317_000628 [Molorchus minor]|uniref:Uncharacterized protein n=1 Tax=Molorchus minor TaxID=1323400 RepID=A0ABQ9JIS7_9CUCU|nr:hypothetical protein NQ317_000628 [Molorchus minor]